MVYTLADDFAAEVADLCRQEVTPGQWERFLDLQVPRHDQAGVPLTGRALTSSDRKRDALQRLYRYDARVAPWAGTAHGVLQAVNTYEHHAGGVRGAPRPERNMLRTVTGDFAKFDKHTYTTLSKVLV